MQAIPIKELRLGRLSPMEREIKSRVNKYFEDMGKFVNGKLIPLSKKGNWSLFSKAIFFFVGFWVNWYLLVFTDLPWFVKILLCISAVFFASGIGFCIMHDGNHGAFSEHSWVNKVAGLSSDSVGVSSGVWKTKHNVVHHDGVNVHHIDEDIEAKPLLRLHDDQKRYWIHKWQHRYWWFAYSLLYIAWILKDFYKYFSGRVMGQRLQFKFVDHILFWAGKAFFVIMFFWIPINRLGFEQWKWGFLIFASLLGFVLSVIFQLAHIMRGVKSSTVEEARGGESVEHQISHTANFAPKSRFINWWAGGLNHQIEHHVFRKISHVHYPDIHEIIKSACEKYNFPMLILPTMRAAFAGHIGRLKDLGQKPK